MIVHIWHDFLTFQYINCLYFFLFLFQLLIWAVIPSLKGSTMTNTKNVLRFSIILQYLPRLFLIFPLSSQIVKATGVVTETAWAGAAYNLMLYMLASHVSTDIKSVFKYALSFFLFYFLCLRAVYGLKYSAL